jgi:peroxiredoxin
MSIFNISIIAALVLAFSGCGQTMDDLNPSASDKRQAVQQGSTGPAVGQHAPDFTVSDSLGNPVTLSAIISQHKAIVLYFTMWCPTCDTHMSYMRDSIIPNQPDVVFYAVDYVSGSVVDARNAELSNGYAGSGFIVLADTAQTLLSAFQGTMGTTVVIDRQGLIQMNEDFKNGAKLQSMLAGLQ